MPLYEGLGYSGEKNAVILDIGTAYTKCGFSNDNGPRCIIPSEVRKQKTRQLVKVHSTTDADELYDILVDFIHVLYFKHLLVNPKDRRVVVVESVLTPTLFRNTIAKVLFKHYEVLSVLFAPSHLMALFTLGITSGLVMDCGYKETQVLPVYEGIPMIRGWQALPLASKAIHKNIKEKLTKFATVKRGQDTTDPLSEDIEDNIVEDIKVRCCFVTFLARSKQIQSVEMGQSDEATLPTPPPPVEYPLDGSRIINIPGEVRERSAEVLFEQDLEEQSIATMILDAILECPIDMRKVLAENIVLVGGTSMMQGFKHRLLTELHQLRENPKYKEYSAISTFKFHSPPAKENFVCWLGGSIFGALEVLGGRSLSREVYLQSGMVPDWSTISDMEQTKDVSVREGKHVS